MFTLILVALLNSKHQKHKNVHKIGVSLQEEFLIMPCYCITFFPLTSHQIHADKSFKS